MNAQACCSKAVPYLLFAVTPIHAGIGREEEEYVDLPIQRDFLGLPVIWGSSIKGALRTTYRIRKIKAGKSEMLKGDEESIIFGPERERAHEHAGSLLIIDAKSFMVPVPSLKGVVSFATCPLMLENAKKIFELCGCSDLMNNVNEIIKLSRAENKVIASSDKLIIDGKVVLRDRVFDATVKNELKQRIESLLSSLNIPISKDFILDRVTVLPDDEGVPFLSRSTISITRIALDYRTKTAREGALWTEEYVPEFTMFLTALIALPPRKQDVSQGESVEPSQIIDALKNVVADGQKDFYIILGGHETIGKGIVKFCGW
jgi:CRISPR-associated protein Cmr4